MTRIIGWVSTLASDRGHDDSSFFVYLAVGKRNLVRCSREYLWDDTRLPNVEGLGIAELRRTIRWLLWLCFFNTLVLGLAMRKRCRYGVSAQTSNIF